MDKQRAYQIKIKGQLEDRPWDWLDEMNIKISHSRDFGTLTTITGLVEDQALLHGILYRLYSVGYVLISVNCLDNYDQELRA
jgi:hypothetical protein